MPVMNAETPRNVGEPVKLPPKKGRPLLDFALPATSVASGVMLGLAVPSLIDANSLADYAKAATLAFAGTAVSYGVNKLAVERGADLGTTGYRGASLVSVAAIATVGLGLWGATYSGLVLKDVGTIMLQEHGQALSAHIGQRSGAASAAARIVPSIRSTEADLRKKAEEEIKTSIISGRGSGGHGTVARVVSSHAGRATSIAQQIETGERGREAIVRQLNADIAAYQGILADNALSASERRTKLQVIDARIRQGIGALDAVVPVALVGAYAKELQSGAVIPGRQEAETRLNAILSRHGKSLSAVLDDQTDAKGMAPSFPGRAGVADTLRYIPAFLPIAAITAVVELVFPLVLWAFTFWGLAWGKHTDELRAASANDTSYPTKPNAPDGPRAPRGPGRPPRLPNGDARRNDH